MSLWRSLSRFYCDGFKELSFEPVSCKQLAEILSTKYMMHTLYLSLLLCVLFLSSAAVSASCDSLPLLNLLNGPILTALVGPSGQGDASNLDQLRFSSVPVKM